MMRKLLILVVGSSLLSGMTCLSGCASVQRTEAQKRGTFERRMAALQVGGFKGSIHIRSGGSPIALNAMTSWSLGPMQLTFDADGDIDFSKDQAGKLTVFPTRLYADLNGRLQKLEHKDNE